VIFNVGRKTFNRTASITIIATSLLSLGAIAATPEIAAAVKSRKANYKEIGGAFKTINDEVKTGAPVIDTIQPLAQEILKRGTMQKDFFPAGSGIESGEKTRAKSTIWTNNADFQKQHNDFLAAAEQLNKAIASGDNKAIATAQKTLGGTCKSCHDQYREADD
jgi:cytochrome c556